MRIAVAYDKGMIGEHFGHAEMFAIYEYQDADVNRCTKRLVETKELHGHQAMADLMLSERVDAVISGGMGAEAKSALLRYGIVPIAGFAGNADDAADLLILGQLPIFEDGGSCSGGCAGCSGCGDGGCECGDDCDCGCGG